MKHYLSLDEQFLHQHGAIHTAQEIAQQPAMWRLTAQRIAQQREALTTWLNPILTQSPLRVILTGAGSSAYVGEALQIFLTKRWSHQSTTVEAISTTDLVSDPMMLQSSRPTLLISFARSGNSPESLAVVKLAEQVAKNCFHLILTCNASGELAQFAQQHDNAYLVLMPEQTEDKSFAMTSSFTSMLLACLCIFSPDANAVEAAAAQAQAIIEHHCAHAKRDSTFGKSRIVFLGAGSLKAIAKEAALKFLELTAGKVTAFHESPLGFRHGPKALVNNETHIVFLPSSDPHCQLYDVDLVNELRHDNIAAALTLAPTNSLNSASDDIWLALPLLVYCQMMAFFRSLHEGLTPDNPFPGGTVNRVVRGVTIYPLTTER